MSSTQVADSRRILIVLRLVFDALVLGVIVWAAIQTPGFHRLARYFPMAIAIMGAGLAALNLAVDVVRATRSSGALSEEISEAGGSTSDDGTTPQESIRRAAFYLVWLVGLLLAIWVVGLPAGSFLWVLAFLHREASWKWWRAGAAALVVVVLLLVISDVLLLHWPDPLLPIQIELTG